MPARRSHVRRIDNDPIATAYRIAHLIEGPSRHLADRAYANGTDEVGMRADWERLRDEIIQWSVFGCEPWPNCPLWVFLTPDGPGFRPWAWWKFDAPEPLPEGETQRAYLERHGLMLPGEAEHPTMREQRARSDAEQNARIESEIAANIAAARRRVADRHG
jgi:hypothetical protein